MTSQIEFCGGGCGHADEVRLHRPCDQHGVDILLKRLAEVVLELAGFVAAHGKARAVIALDVERSTPEHAAEIVQTLNRGWRMGERRSR